MSVTTVNCQEKSKKKFPSIPLFLQKEKDSSRFRNEHGLEVWKRSAGGRPGIEKSLSSCAARVASTYMHIDAWMNGRSSDEDAPPLGIHTVMVAFEASVLGRKDRAYRYLKNTRSKRGKRNRKVDGREISTSHADT